jgi:ABC-type nitrate/sulfonate/bicarbonate transport system ATPase subunit
LCDRSFWLWKVNIQSDCHGLDSYSGGEILIDGQPIMGPSPERGMVFQGYTLFPWKTVKENVMFGPKMKGQSDSTDRGSSTGMD